MKTLGLALLTVMAVGCHFDNLFNANGGSQAQSGGTAPATTHLIFATQPDLRIDQPGLAAYTLTARNGELSDVESGSFYVGP